MAATQDAMWDETCYQYLEKVGQKAQVAMPRPKRPRGATLPQGQLTLLDFFRPSSSHGPVSSPADGPANEEAPAMKAVDVPMRQKTIVNNFKPMSRTYRWLKHTHEEVFFEAIVDDLVNGKNVVVVSMSSEKIAKFTAQLVLDAILEEGEILSLTAHTDDAIRKQMEDVDAMWSKKRCVMYSPTVEAGIGEPWPSVSSIW